jgi:hypothetical protein
MPNITPMLLSSGFDVPLFSDFFFTDSTHSAQSFDLALSQALCSGKINYAFLVLDFQFLISKF